MRLVPTQFVPQLLHLQVQPLELVQQVHLELPLPLFLQTELSQLLEEIPLNMSIHVHDSLAKNRA